MEKESKTAEEGVLKKINERTKKLLNQPVSKRIGELLKKEGDLERKLNEEKRVAAEKRQPDMGL